MHQSNQARAIISLGFPQGAGRPPNPSASREQYPRYCSTAGTVARQPPSLPPPQSSQSHLPPPPCATTAPRSRRARIILRPSSHAYNLRPRLGRDPIPINIQILDSLLHLYEELCISIGYSIVVKHC